MLAKFNAVWSEFKLWADDFSPIWLSFVAGGIGYVAAIMIRDAVFTNPSILITATMLLVIGIPIAYCIMFVAFLLDKATGVSYEKQTELSDF